MCASETLGCRLIALCQEQLGLHVPGEVAILGVAAGDINADSQPVGLSRVGVDLERVGYEAARMLAQLMRGERPESDIVRIPPRTVVLRESTDRQHLQDHEVNRALQFIRLNADRPIQVADVVAVVRVSRSTLKTRFRRERNRTIQEEIRRAHVERAKLLLRHTKFSLSRIAADCGFVQSSRLSESFKRETGLTPRAYRQAAHREQLSDSQSTHRRVEQGRMQEGENA
jgi:LacI family transcriptional regulator